MANKTNIKDLVALVTGASSGIGQACCLELARKGCHIGAVARSEDKLKEVVEECRKLGVNAAAITADLSSADGAQSAIDACVQKLGGLNILINAAGTWGGTEKPLEEWEKCINLNLMSLMRLTNLAVPHLEKKEGGAIINIASISGRMAMGEAAPYCASKYGVVGFSLSMFEALREKGIKVCSIEPGMVNTPMVTGDRLDRSKMIQPEDIAHTVAFVAKFPMTACPKEIMISPQKSPRQ
ncbi:clavaldehyde dehydrogenase [Acanthamoeba castellanii str. Neff]|uniref:3-oxoacyl-[acyl-carrier-protein] reductase n=1 Tax=Acanthamoeba castellanii (strain ATCC 30010 / Neff) TaxID=1257118 RepID=L8H156_ACACF|nr:clavaldehyde dehydrogenase [Acanthamoeba castellanii str. Neff]ELR18498.1 clavaldehyde dehydrogenase [Acanthamoeba castellanii str. Neff]